MKRQLTMIGLGALAAAAALALATGPAPATGSASKPAVAWKPCKGAPKLRCGSIRVPVDWAKPEGAKITIGFARRPADTPAQRVGTLFFEPGGPNDGGISYLEPGAAESVFSATLRARFDIVGIDPRGYGESTRIRCGIPFNVPGLTLFPRTQQQFHRLVEHNRAVGMSCLKHTGALVGHVDAESVARDHEAVRAALGIPTMSFLFISYDAQVAAIYAQLYPSHIRTMAIDAVLEHDLSNTLAVAGEVSTVEDAFNRFAAWCKTAPTCALKGKDVGRFYDELVARADRAPMRVNRAVHPVTGEDIRLGTQRGLLFKYPAIYGPDLSWAGLSHALKAAGEGDATAFATEPTRSHIDGDYYEQAVICNDYPSPIHTYAEMRRLIEMGTQLAPHLQGASQAWATVRCIGWPVKAANPPRHLDVRGAPPILLVNATHDASTTYAWAHGLAEQIHGSVLLTRVGDGHTSYYSSPCARAAIDRYLIAGRTPAPDAVCTS